jgi:hypothetical protein
MVIRDRTTAKPPKEDTTMTQTVCRSVVGGWQSFNPDMGGLFGPVFNKTTDLWAWQGAQADRNAEVLAEIKEAVEAGRRVHWQSPAYEVIKDSLGQWLIVCHLNGDCIGLTWRDGVKLNGKPDDFFIIQKATA